MGVHALTGLTIAADLTLPLDWITFSTCVYGARGSGKTTLGRVMAEEAYAAGQRFCAVDLKGDWWGLKASEDGQTEGIPVVIFGGDHADVPLEAEAGAEIANTVAELHHPVVLDLEHLSKGKQVRFLGAFFDRLYDANRDPLLLLLDEAQRYAPQRPMSPEAAVCLGAVEDLVKLGRKHGIGPVLFTQRGSGLNKEVSELCDLLIAFRTPGPLDQDRIKDWLDANTTREQRDTVMGSLSKMPTGTAVFASGHPALQLFQTAAVRLPRTFDSSATPQIGSKPRVPKRLAPVDLDAIRGRMTAAIERAEASDPKKLRARIAELERALAAKPAVEKVTVEVVKPVLQGPELRAAQAIVKHAEQVIAQLTALTGSFAGLTTVIAGEIRDATKAGAEPAPRDVARHMPPPQRVPPPAPPAPAPARVNGAVAPTGESDVALARVERAILTVLAQWPEGRTAQQVGIISGYSATAGGFRNGLSRLRTAGLIVGPSAGLRITTDGLAAIGPVEPAPTGSDLLQMWLGHPSLGKAERAILGTLGNEMRTMSAAEIGEATGYSATAGGFRNALSKLRTLRLIEGPGAAMHISADML